MFVSQCQCLSDIFLSSRLSSSHCNYLAIIILDHGQSALSDLALGTSPRHRDEFDIKRILDINFEIIRTVTVLLWSPYNTVQSCLISYWFQNCFPASKTGFLSLSDKLIDSRRGARSRLESWSALIKIYSSRKWDWEVKTFKVKGWADNINIIQTADPQHISSAERGSWELGWDPICSVSKKDWCGGSLIPRVTFYPKLK